MSGEMSVGLYTAENTTLQNRQLTVLYWLILKTVNETGL